MSTPAPEMDPRRGLRLVTRAWTRPAWLRREWWTDPAWRSRAQAALAWARHDPRRAAVVAVAGLAVTIGASQLSGPPLPPGVALAEVKQGPFRVSLVEAGTLQALCSVTTGRRIQSNQAKIVAPAPRARW